MLLVLYNQEKFESSIEFRLSRSISLHGTNDMVFCFILLAVLITYMSELAEKKKKTRHPFLPFPDRKKIGCKSCDTFKPHNIIFRDILYPYLSWYPL